MLTLYLLLCSIIKYFKCIFLTGTFPFSVCLTSCSWAHGLYDHGPKTSLTHHCTPSLEHTARCLENGYWVNTWSSIIQLVRPNTRFVCPGDLLLIPSSGCYTPDTTDDTEGNKKLQPRRAVTPSHIYSPLPAVCMQARWWDEALPFEASSFASADLPQTLGNGWQENSNGSLF